MARVRTVHPPTIVPTSVGTPTADQQPPRARSGKAKPRRIEATPSAGSVAWRQIGVIVGIAICAFVAVALASWNPDDPSLSVAGGGVIRNRGGPIGAGVADLLYQSAGYSAWSVIAVGAYLALRLAGRTVGGWLAGIVAAGGVWMLSAGLELVLGGGGERAFPAGGFVGIVTADALVGQIGRFGALLVVFTGVLASATILFGINWQPIAAGAVDRVVTGTPAAARVVGAAGAGFARAGVGAGGAMVDRWRAHRVARAQHAPDDEESDVAEGGSAHEIDPVDAIAPPVSVWSARPPPAPRLALPAPVDRDRDTQIGGKALVEVEYEPTTSGSAADLPFAALLAPAPIARPGSVSSVPTSAEVPEYDILPAARVPILERSSRVFEPISETEEVVSADVGAPMAPPSPVSPRPIDANDAPEPPRLLKRRSGGVQVVPGDLRSGGSGDDGLAVRETKSPYQLPPLSLLDDHPAIVGAADEGRLHDLSRKLVAKLHDFGVDGKVVAIRPGPVITMFEFEPAAGIRISKIENLENDIAMALRAQSVRVVAPIPGRGVVGVEVPNDVRQTVWARDVFASNEFRDARHTLPLVLGKDTEGRPYVADLARMPHLLVGGTTGAGKSVGINAMLVSLLFTRGPDELRMILIDPKQLEFELYKDIPHLLHPVVTDARLASKVLAWACVEMDQRYGLLADWKVRNIDSYNAKVEHEEVDWTVAKAREYFPDWPEGQLMPRPRKLPFIVVVIDELADLMMVASKDVETSICRLAQKARACGIHLVVATQSPRAQVVTGLIKGNMPSKVAYQVRTGMESRIILDSGGAETLLGKGDLLFLPPGVGGLTRIHGPFLGDEEVRRVADFLRGQGKPDYAPAIRVEDEDEEGEFDAVAEDQLSEQMAKFYDQIVEFALDEGKISTSMIQRKLKIGYNRASLLMDHLEKEGIVAKGEGAKPRKVLAER